MKQTIIGRLTADAVTRVTKEDVEVLNFTVAINEKFRKRGTDEIITKTEYINCAKWNPGGVAKHLTKGRLVEVSGNLGCEAWTRNNGELGCGFNLKVGKITLHGYAAAEVAEEVPAEQPENNKQTQAKKTKAKAGKSVDDEDLPF